MENRDAREGERSRESRFRSSVFSRGCRSLRYFALRFLPKPHAGGRGLVFGEDFGDGGDFVVVILKEGEYLVAGGGLGDVFADAAHGVQYRCVALLDVTVAFGDVVDVVFGVTASAKDECVDAVV